MDKRLLKNMKILIVDDKSANIEVLETLLGSEGYTNIRSTLDSREVLEIYLTWEPDLILLDLMMPYMSGFDVMEQLKLLTTDQVYLPVLVLTADASNETKMKALASGASDFLSKPFDLLEVSLRIQNLLFTNYLYTQIRDQNEILEEKVKERTRELESKNSELKVAWEKAEKSNQLKTAFLHNISHEIRTPLNGILGFGNLLSDTSASMNKKKIYLNMMQESSERLINTINNYLDISQLNTGNMDMEKSEINTSSLMGEVFQNYSLKSTRKNIQFIIPPHIWDHEVVFVSDESKVLKILSHLTDNAIKFTEKGEVEIGFEKLRNEIQFYVRDTGIGINDEIKDEIFHDFIQGSTDITRGYEGNGLGLAIAKSMTELLNGKIWFKSVPGEGTTFFFTVPLEETDNKLTDQDQL